MIFMKGIPSYPLCLDSKKLMGILSKYPALMCELEYFDLAKDPEIIVSLLAYSNFGEVPQLYIDYKLLGGCEIIDALDSTGELSKLIGPKDTKIVKKIQNSAIA